MSHDENFNGDRLRLASFLRVVEKIPQQRPARFKRRVQEIALERHTNEEAVDVQQSRTRNDASHSVLKFYEPSAAHPDLDTNDAGLPSALGTTAKATRTKEAIAPDGTIQQGDSNIVEHTASGGLALQQLNAQSILQVSRKRKVVHESNANKTDARFPGDSSTRIRQLLVNGLALVMTSTVHGLPEPSGTDDSSSSPLYISADPIEDSQSSWQAALISRHRHVQTPPTARSARQKRSTRKYTWTSNRGSVKRARRQESRLVDHSHKGQLQQSNFERVADGFVGSEIVLTSRPKKPFTIPRTGKQRATPRPNKGSALKTRGLILTAGYLPDEPVGFNIPHFVSKTATGAAAQQNLLSTSSMIEFDCVLPPDARPHPGAFATSQARAPGKTRSAIRGHKQNTTPTSSHRTGVQSQNMSRRPTYAEVVKQLSNIRAPVRKEIGSEEEDDEEPRAVDDDNSEANELHW